ncbi:hypothetical protein EYF80_047057 [Liparis tanakae]|uniref:Uncharacterized protein n=1 Tax=Liparis tanakae TaxID=230148 RepID=A0A4Z2FNZ6_9TELE|nr:hypothetical protein EYF80_047057 [Liparis tanakae]
MSITSSPQIDARQYTQVQVRVRVRVQVRWLGAAEMNTSSPLCRAAAAAAGGTEPPSSHRAPPVP